MNTQRINTSIAKRLKMPKALVARITASYVGKIIKELKTSKRPLRLPGLGRFKVSTVKSHPGYDIRTGGTREFPKSVRVHFKTDNKFKVVLNYSLKEKQKKDKADWLAARQPKQTALPETVSAPTMPHGFPVSPPAPTPRQETPPVIQPSTMPVSVAQNSQPVPEPAPLLETPPQPAPAPAQTMIDWESGKSAEVTQEARPQIFESHKEEAAMDTPETAQKTVSEVQSIIKETADHVQRRMLIIFGMVLAGLCLILSLTVFLAYKSVIRSAGFYNFLKTRIMMVNEENKLTYEEIDALVAKRMKEMQLDISQTKDIFKNELYAMQDSSEKRIRGLVMADVSRELRKMPRTMRTAGKTLIRIIKYRVRKGDNLWMISQRKSDNPYNWVGIYQTNGHRIKNPDLIYPGQEFLIPIVIRY